MNEQIGKYLSVQQANLPGQKTCRWWLFSTEGDTLGIILWHVHWRQYGLETFSKRVFHNGCLRDIAAFLDKQNAAHRTEAWLRREGSK